MHIPRTLLARGARFGQHSRTGHRYLKCICGDCSIWLKFLDWVFSTLKFHVFVSGNVLNTTPTGAWYISDKMSSSRVDHGPFSDVLKDMLSKEFGHLNLASNISKVSLCLTTLIYRFSSLRGDIDNGAPCHAFRSVIKSLVLLI